MNGLKDAINNLCETLSALTAKKTYKNPIKGFN